MAIFTINITENESIGIDNLPIKLYYNTSQVVPSTNNEIQASPSINLNKKIEQITLLSNENKHFIAFPEIFILNQIIEIKNSYENILSEFILDGSVPVNISGEEIVYSIYVLETSIPFSNNTPVLINFK